MFKIKNLKLDIFSTYIIVSLLTCVFIQLSPLIPFIVFILLVFITIFKWKERIIPLMISTVLFLSFFISWLMLFQEQNLGNIDGSIYKIQQIKSSYIIVGKGFKKYYISIYNLSVDELILNRYIKIYGNVSELDIQNEYYQFDFKNYLNSLGIKNQIEIEHVKYLSKGFLYKLNKFYNGYFINDLTKIFMLSDHDKDIDLIQSMNKVSLTYLLNFSGLNIFLISILFGKIFRLFKIKYKTINITQLTMDSMILLFCFTLNFPFILTKTILFLFIKNIFNLKHLKVDKLKLWLVAFSLLISLNNQVLLSDSFYYYLVGLLFYSQPKMNKLSFKITYNMILSSLSFLIINMMIEYRFYYFNELFDLLFGPIIALLNLFILLTFWIPNIEIIFNFLNKLFLNEFELLNKINYFYSVGMVPKIYYLIYVILLFINIKFLHYKFNYILIIILISNLIFIFIYKEIFFETSFSLLRVGNGQTMIFKSKKEVIIFDAGSGIGHSKNLLSDYLKYFGINKIDKLFISHYHDDHYNQIDSLNKNDIKIKEIINRNNNEYSYITEHLKIEVFNLNLNDKNENNNSLIYFVEINNKKILIMSDLEKEGEIELIKNERFRNIIDNNLIDYMIAGHHGSKTSSSREFLEIVKPKLFLISGEDRSNRHFPDLKVINTLNELHIKWLLTSIEGNIKLKF